MQLRSLLYHFGRSPREIKMRHIGNCPKADPAYGSGVAGAPGIPLEAVLQ